MAVMSKYIRLYSHEPDIKTPPVFVLTSSDPATLVLC